MRSDAQSCLTLCNPLDGSPPSSSVHGNFQARILEWIAKPLSRGSSQPGDQTGVSCIADEFFTNWAIREAPQKLLEYYVTIVACYFLSATKLCVLIWVLSAFYLLFYPGYFVSIKARLPCLHACCWISSVLSYSLQSYALWPTRFLCPWHFPGKNTGVGCHALLQGIFPTQGWNLRLLCLLHGQVDNR